MPQNSTATFHPFPRLPLELRIQIWESATEDRVLRVKKAWLRTKGYWSPTPPPAVTRASHESRQHCRYQKAFILNAFPRYIWANFNHDNIQMRCSLLSEESLLERATIRHLRIELVDAQGWDETYSFLHKYVHKVRDFPKLEGFDLLVGNGELRLWTEFIGETYWAACPRANVRVVDEKTGEWIDEETSGAHREPHGY